MNNQTYEIPNEFWDLMKKLPSNNMAEKSTLFPVIKKYISGGADIATWRYFEKIASDYFEEIVRGLNYEIKKFDFSLLKGRPFWHCAHHKNDHFIFQYNRPINRYESVGAILIDIKTGDVTISMNGNNSMNEEVLWAHFMIFLDSFKT